jgi:hypothetical protein
VSQVCDMLGKEGGWREGGGGEGSGPLRSREPANGAPCNTGRLRSPRSHEVRHHLCVRARTGATLWIDRRDAMIFDPNFDQEKKSCPLSPYDRPRRVLNEPGLSRPARGLVRAPIRKARVRLDF